MKEKLIATVLSRPHGRGSRNETDDITLAAHFGHAHTGVGVEIIGHQERAIRRYRHAHTGVGVEIAVQWLRGCKFWSRLYGRGSRNHMSFCRPSAPARHAHTGVGE